MISLCITTMDRYDSFLSDNLPKYISNPYINEIIINDENGNDFEMIKKNFSNEKLKVYKNESILGPFLNKIDVLKKAKNKWICLMDSDNFADIEYFRVVTEFLKKKRTFR